MHPIDFVRAACVAHPNFVFGILVAWVVSTIASLAVRALHSERFTDFEKAHPILGGVAHAVFGVLGNGDQVRRGVLLILGAFGIVPPTTPLGGGGAGAGGAAPAAPSTSAYRVAVEPGAKEPRPGFGGWALASVLALTSVVGIAAVAPLTGCAAFVKEIPLIVDVTSQICTELDAKWQDEPGWVKFACAVVEGEASAPGPKTAKAPVVVRIPEADAETFRMRHVDGYAAAKAAKGK